MTKEVYYVIKVMVRVNNELKQMFFNLETENLLENWMGACTQDYTQDELSFVVTAFSLNWENKLIKQWGSLFPDLSFNGWEVMKAQVELQTV